NRVGSCQIHHAVERLARNQHIDCPNEVGVMNPGNKLRAGPLPPAEAAANQAEEYVENSTSIRAEGHRTADRDLPRARCRSREESIFPRLRNVDRKLPRVGSAW